MRRILSALALAMLLLPWSAAGAIAAAEEPRVLSSTYRVDLGDVLPGEMRTGELVLSNPGYETVTARLLHEGDPIRVETPAEVRIPPGASEVVRYSIRVPVDVQAGFHGEAVKIQPRASTPTQGAGTLDAGTAVVFTWRHSAVGVSAIEAPPIALPGENVTGALVLVSTWPAATNASARLEWRDGTGGLIAAKVLGPAALAANGTARVAFELASAEATPGAQTLTARVVDAGTAPLAGAQQQTLHMGRKEAIFRLASVEDLRDGNASVLVVVENTGDVPTTVTPRVLVRDANGAVREVLLAPITLAPGERREIESTIELPPGRFAIDAEAEGASRAITTAAGGDAPLELTMRAPPQPSRWIEIATILGAIALGVAILVLAWRRRSDLAKLRAVIPKRKPRAPKVASEAPVAEIDEFDALFTKLDVGHATPAPPPRVGAALLVDVETLGGGGGLPRLLDIAGDRRIDVAYAYACASSPEAAADVHRALASLGFVPRVIPHAPDFHIEMTLDAGHEAAAGRVIVIASADAAFQRLARALEQQGARVEILAPARRVPVQEPARDAVNAKRV